MICRVSERRKFEVRLDRISSKQQSERRKGNDQRAREQDDGPVALRVPIHCLTLQHHLYDTRDNMSLKDKMRMRRRHSILELGQNCLLSIENIYRIAVVTIIGR